MNKIKLKKGVNDPVPNLTGVVMRDGKPLVQKQEDIAKRKYEDAVEYWAKRQAEEREKAKAKRK